LSSNRPGEREQGSRPSRVIKSDSRAAIGFAFPDLDVPSALDLTPAPLSDVLPGDSGASEQQRSEVSLFSGGRAAVAAASDMEARARALERRAAHVLDEAVESAARRVQEAEAEAQTILAGASEVAERARLEAVAEGQAAGYEEGYARGLEAGNEAAESLLAEARTEADAMLAQAANEAEARRTEALSQREQWLTATQAQLLDLTFAMARQVLKTELTLRPEAMLPMLEAALAKLRGEEEPVLRVSPEVLALLDGHRGRLLAALPGARRVNVEADAGLAPGDFVLQGNQGLVDGRLDRQMQTLEAALREEER